MSSAPEANTEGSSNFKVELRLLPLLMKFFKLSGAGLAVWIIGYINFSFLWVIIGLLLFVSNEEYKKSKNNRRFYTQQATQNEKEAITARLADLPSWVYFPDIERAEWLNKMVQQFWPFVGDYVNTLLTNTVGPQVEQSLPEKLRPFKFTEIDLGDLPPRIGGVKVYTDNVKRDEIIMDMEILYASDSRFKVSMRGMSAGIKDFSLRADMRIILNPLCNVIPLFGGLTFFFLRNPEIDFDLTDMANALDFLLIGNTVRSVIEDQISAMLVLPNRQVIPILKDVDLKKLAYPLPQGVLRIHAIGASELEKKDIGLLGKGKSDPYCEIEAGAQVFKTGVCENTIEPTWNEYFEVVLEHTHGQSVNIRCFDYDSTGDNDSLGSASIDIAEIMRQGLVDTWVALNKVKTGMVHMRYLWLYLSNNPVDLDKSHKDGKKSEDMLSSAVLLVMLDSAKNLTSSKKLSKEPSPRVKLTVGNESKMSMVKQKTSDPRWEQNFVFMLVDPRVQALDLEVMDTAKDDKTIGTLSVPVRSLLDAQDLIVERPYFLDANGATSEMTVSLRLCLRILTSKPLLTEHCNNNEVKLKYTSGDSTSSDKSTTAAPAANKTQPTQQQTTNNNSTTSDGAQPNAGGVGEGNGKVEDALSGGTEVRRRSAAPGGVVPSSKFGSINVTLRYSSQRSRLVCVVHKCVKLIPCDSSYLADPYVRLYLLPERSNATKRKTQVQKDTVNPVFDETFDWPMSVQEFASKSIEVSVKNSVSLLSKQRENMGKVVIALSNYDITKPVTEWFDLQDPGED